jgi:hypothetical protein
MTGAAMLCCHTPVLGEPEHCQLHDTGDEHVACAAGDDGADALAAAAASSTTLRKLKLSGNPVSAAQLDVVQHVLKTREYKWWVKAGRPVHLTSAGQHGWVVQAHPG